ncbi:iron ABC transporter permease [Rhizobium rhizosphaerae]|uniref:Iron ABC transporter permease n=1 Tax=Xaviernesmea rhizosphaerae TaxID=1672749 RepID=A0A1Q9ADK6_9HYPH|nr:iron ABC transporter permease [Xaviernesmea rhizosphaerae]OLP52992.1 iron ABC transporter permease [Xaviernesmea rhizosphaerae]
MSGKPAPGGRPRAGLMLGLLGALLAASCLLSLCLGPRGIGLGTVFDALLRFDGSREHLLVVTLRLPRMLAAVLAGSALAVSGAIMQAVTGNPLASPGLLGINAGAAFAVVAVMTLTGGASGVPFLWAAFAGAGAAAVTVYLLGAVFSSVHAALGLVLSGAAIATFLTSLTSAVLIFDQSTLDAVRLWTAGSVSGRTLAEAVGTAPYIGLGLSLAFLLGRHLTVLSFGADAARALGQSPVFWRGAAILIVILLAGSAVALAGPIGFVGLIVPHIVRMLIGVDYRWILPFCAVGGALLVVAADCLGRSLLANQGFPVGVTIALIGAPFFIWLAHNRLRSTA